MRDPRGKRGVGAHFELQMYVGDFGRLRAARIDRDDLHASGLGGKHHVPPTYRLTPAVRGADHEDLGFRAGRRADVFDAEVERFADKTPRAAGGGTFGAPG